MKKTIVFIVALSFILLPASVRAGMVGTPDPVEQNLIENQRLQREVMKDLNKPASPSATASKTETPRSNMWKWALGIAIVGGVAFAASGRDGGGSGDNGGGTVVVTY